MVLLPTFAAAHGQYTAQQVYDNAYTQCMYSRGNQVPGYYAPAPAPIAAPWPPPMAAPRPAPSNVPTTAVPTC